MLAETIPSTTKVRKQLSTDTTFTQMRLWLFISLLLRFAYFLELLPLIFVLVLPVSLPTHHPYFLSRPATL